MEALATMYGPSWQLRLHSGVQGPLDELKRLNKELIDLQANAMTAAPDRREVELHIHASNL